MISSKLYIHWGFKKNGHCNFAGIFYLKTPQFCVHTNTNYCTIYGLESLLNFLITKKFMLVT